MRTMVGKKENSQKIEIANKALAQDLKIYVNDIDSENNTQEKDNDKKTNE